MCSENEKFTIVSFDEAKRIQEDGDPLYYRIRDNQFPHLMRPFQKAAYDHVLTSVDDYAIKNH